MRGPREAAGVVRQWVEASDRRSMAEWRKFVRGTGLSMPQLGVLMRLYYGGTSGVHDIGRGLGVSAAAASQMVDRLVQSRLVEREENPSDRRAREVALTARGRQVLDRGIRERYRWVDDLVGGLAARQLASVLRAMPPLIEAEKKLPDAIPGRRLRR
jgi:DNA-binding MarR family transcriptional regulator